MQAISAMCENKERKVTGGRSFRGVVVPGRGLGVPLMSCGPVQQALRRLTDLDIVPGTLNVRLPRPFDTRLEGYISGEEFGGVVAGGWYAEVVIEGRFRGFVFRGDEPGYPPDLVELISDHHLRKALGLQDGDEVEFTLVERTTHVHNG